MTSRPLPSSIKSYSRLSLGLVMTAGLASANDGAGDGGLLQPANTPTTASIKSTIPIAGNCLA